MDEPEHRADSEPAATEDEEWVSMDQAAKRLASSRRVVTRWAQTGKLGEIKPGRIGRGMGMRVRASAVDARVAGRSEDVRRRVVREAERKARLEEAARREDPAYGCSGAASGKHSLKWMLELVNTLSETANESFPMDALSAEDSEDVRRLFAGIGSVRESLGRLSNRRTQDQ